MHADVAALIGAEPGPLDVTREPEAQIFSVSASAFLLSAKFWSAECVDRHGQRPAVLAAVEGHFEAVGKQQSFARIGEFLFQMKLRRRISTRSMFSSSAS